MIIKNLSETFYCVAICKFIFGDVYDHCLQIENTKINKNMSENTNLAASMLYKISSEKSYTRHLIKSSLSLFSTLAEVPHHYHMKLPVNIILCGFTFI